MADSPGRTTSGAPGGAERRGCGVVHRTTSESLRLGELASPPSLPSAASAAAVATQQHNPRKISSFQITSVTVGGRASADAGEDSADDLDESHADDLSRLTDFDNETPSRSEDTFSRDDVFYNASASLTLGSAPVIPTSSQYGLAIVGQEPADVNDMRVATGAAIVDVASDNKPQEGAKEIQEHVRNERFKVVKIESTEPFRRGRWMCMDYLDHTTTQQSAPIVVNNNLDGTETSALIADSGVVINDIQHDEGASVNDLTNKELQAPPSVLQLEQKSFPIASPGQSLTQPLKVQQQMAPAQTVSVQSPPLEMPQQMSGQTLQAGQQVGQQHAQSMTHITLQNAPQSHPPPTQPQPVQQMPQSFPQHQLQQVIAQSQGMPQMQPMSMHQQIPQQIQQIPNQSQIQQIAPQHLPQNQLAGMQQMPQMSQMQTIQNQNQMQVQNQQTMQQIQMQQMQSQPNPPQIHQMQQPQIPNMTQQTHHLQGQSQAMGSQQPQLQHMTSQAQLQAMNPQLPNHIQQMQMTGQVPQMASANQQMPQMQPQLHPMTSQATNQQQQVVAGMHAQLQQGMTSVQPQYNQAVNQQSNAQALINPAIPSSQQAMVSQQHSVPQYHTQQSQMSQQGQTLPPEVLTNIASSHQGAGIAANLQSLPSQPPGSTLPSNLQGMNQQNTMHSMAQQPQSLPQGAIQMMTNPPQNIPMSLDSNQPTMQMPVSDPIYMQSANVGPQIQMGQHMSQAQNLMAQQVPTTGQAPSHLAQQNQMGMQYVLPQQQVMSNQTNVANPQCVVSQANMQSVNQPQGTVQNMGQQLPQQPPAPIMQSMVNQVQHQQNIPMSMQQSLPVSMQGGVHAVATSVVQSQTNMQPSMQAPGALPMSGYSGQAVVSSMPQSVMPIMSHTSMSQQVGIQNQQMEAVQVISGTSSPVVSLAVTSQPYPQPHSANQLDGQNFGSPVSAVVSHVVNSLVNNSVGLTAGESGALEVNDTTQVDLGDGRLDEALVPGVSEDESASGTSAVAIDNKIEQAMDLVKSHLMFAVREEVEVLKERIAELMERITQLEMENTYLRAHASQDTLAQLPAPGAKPAPLPPAGPPPPAS